MTTVRVESLKSSFAKPPEPLGFDITDNGLVFGPAPEAPKQETTLERACEFLKMELRKEPQRFTALLEKAEASGFSKNTLYREGQGCSVHKCCERLLEPSLTQRNGKLEKLGKRGNFGKLSQTSQHSQGQASTMKGDRAISQAS